MSQVLVSYNDLNLFFVDGLLHGVDQTSFQPFVVKVNKPSLKFIGIGQEPRGLGDIWNVVTIEVFDGDKSVGIVKLAERDGNQMRNYFPAADAVKHYVQLTETVFQSQNDLEDFDPEDVSFYK